jgi:hypothetical protein
MFNVRKLAVIALLIAGVGRSFGATYWEDRFRYDVNSTDLYPPSEVSLDLFGVYSDHSRDGGDEDLWGGGLGLNFFLSRMVGIGVDTYTDRWKLPQLANASLIVRFPSSYGFAPYGFGGGGRNWDHGFWQAHAGGGLELRFNRYTGLFADGRRVFPEKGPDYTLARAGIRLGF